MLTDTQRKNYESRHAQHVAWTGSPLEKKMLDLQFTNEILLANLKLALRCMEGSGMYAHGGSDRDAVVSVRDVIQQAERK